MVNGNVLVPLASERTPLTTDPAARAIVQRFLDAYPAQLPNRPDFDPRALNTNAPQVIDAIDGTARLDRDIAKAACPLPILSLGSGPTRFSWSPGRTPIAIFIRIGYGSPCERACRRPPNSFWPALSIEPGRLLTPEPNAVGPRVRFGFQIEELGPDSHFPTNRTLNSFRYGAQMAHVDRRAFVFLGRGRHSLPAERRRDKQPARLLPVHE